VAARCQDGFADKSVCGPAFATGGGVNDCLFTRPETDAALRDA
jgi:hypothetical protein